MRTLQWQRGTLSTPETEQNNQINLRLVNLNAGATLIRTIVHAYWTCDAQTASGSGSGFSGQSIRARDAALVAQVTCCGSTEGDIPDPLNPEFLPGKAQQYLWYGNPPVPSWSIGATDVGPTVGGVAAPQTQWASYSQELSINSESRRRQGIDSAETVWFSCIGRNNGPRFTNGNDFVNHFPVLYVTYSVLQMLAPDVPTP